MVAKKTNKVPGVKRARPRVGKKASGATRTRRKAPAGNAGVPAVGTVLAPGAVGTAMGHGAGAPGSVADPSQGPSAAVIAASQGPATTDLPPRGQATGTGGPGTPAGSPRVVNPSVRQRKPKGNQAALAGTVAAEIRRAAANGTYRTVFGQHAPDPEQLATELEQAGAASLTAARAEQTWLTARDDRNHRWDAVLTGKVDPFQACFQWAVEHDASIEEQFPSTAVFLRTTSVISARSAATRRARAAAAAAATPQG